MDQLSQQQRMLSDGLEQFTTQTSGLLTTYAEHAQALEEAKNTTTDLLESVAAVTEKIGNLQDVRHSSLFGLGISHWVPYIVSPIATLLLGSYGLEPSAMRNLGLVALGEVFGFVVSHARQVTESYMTVFAYTVVNNETVTSF